MTLTVLGLAGCGLSRFEQREPWRKQAEEACLSQKLVHAGAYMSRTSAISGPGTCGMDYPFKVAAFADGTVGLNRQVTLACPIIPRIDGWLNEVVQPAAGTYFGTSVAEVRSGTYSCRPRNNQRGAKLSEHSFGNAIDVMAFRLADGREITVVKGWRGAPEEQEFLREVFVGACQHFTTVLGPGADPFHYDHFHLDLARHDPRGERRVCKPVIKFTPRIDGEAALRASPVRPTPEPAPADLSQEGEEDGDTDESPVAAVPRRAPQVAAAPRPALAMGFAAAPVARAPGPTAGAQPPLPPRQTTAYAGLPASGAGLGRTSPAAPPASVGERRLSSPAQSRAGAKAPDDDPFAVEPPRPPHRVSPQRFGRQAID